MVVRRLVLPGAMMSFLLLSLAYWWLDNLPHELFGTVMFGLLAWHISVNRHWFSNVFVGRYDARRILSVALHVLLIGNMVALLVTSIAISKSVFALLPFADSTLFREIHWFAAYWVMIAVGLHIGLHWGRVMATTRSLLDLSPPNRIRTSMLRVAAVLVTVFGVSSWTVLDVWNKLTFTYSMEFWDFTASVSPFFGHWVGVVGLAAIATHYTMVLAKRNWHPADVDPRKRGGG